MSDFVGASLAFICQSRSLVSLLVYARPSRPRPKVSAGVSWRDDHGQGLVEYALILALAVVVVIAILMVLGPGVGGLFSQVKTALEFGTTEEAVADASASRTGISNSNDLEVTFRVLTDTTVQVTDSQSGQTIEVACSAGLCSVTLPAVGHDAGTVTITTDDGRTTTVDYPPKP